jgi:hypothetical protein
MPGNTLSDGQLNLGFICVPAPLGEDARHLAQIGVLRDEHVKNGLVNPLNCRVHRRSPHRWVPAGQVHIIGNHQILDLLRQRRHASRGQGDRRRTEPQHSTS